MGGEEVRGRRRELERYKLRFKVGYYTAYASLFLFLTGSNWFFLVDQSSPLSVFLFVVMAFLFIGLTYNILDVACYYLCRPDRLPALSSSALADVPLSRRRVAVLYCSYNDVDEDCLSVAGGQDHPVTVFVLDDSTDPEHRRRADRAAGRHGYTLVRRAERKGFKAGALNNWLRRWGKDFDYIVILDSDSILPSDFVTRALLHALHSENTDVSVFQGKVQIYNKDTEFTRLLAFSPMLWYPSFERLCNRLDWMMCWGHNTMLRVGHVVEAGGWDEEQVSEDFALALDLYKSGKRCVMMPVETYEMCPPDYQAYKKRACRWAKGTLGCFSFLRLRGVPLSTKFMLFLTGWCTLAFFGYTLALFFMVYGYSSTGGSVEALLATVAYDISALFSEPVPLALVLFYFTFLIFGRVTLAPHYGIRVREYLRQVILGMALNMCLMLPMVYHQLLAAAGRKAHFTVTPKTRGRTDLRLFLTTHSSHMTFTSILLAGAFVLNPITLFYNFFWLGMMVLAPVLIWRWEGRRTDGGGGDRAGDAGRQAVLALHRAGPRAGHMRMR